MCKSKKWVLAALFSILIIISAGWVERVQPVEKYPTRAIDLIVPFAPGGSTDLTMRVLGTYLRKKWGVPINVVNKPGGNTVPASLEVYTAKPDGYTLLADGTPSCSMLPIVVKNIPFEIMDRTFVGSFSINPFVFSVYPGSPFKSLKDAEAEAKKDQENFTWTSLGGAALHDFAFRQFYKKIGVDVTKTKPVMAPGGAPAIVLTAGGNVKLGGGSLPASIPAISGKTIRPLAISSKVRWPDFPDLPTTAEAGYPIITASEYKSVSGPPKMPAYIIEVWDKALQEMVKDPEVLAQLKNVGAFPFYRNSRDIIEYTLRETQEVKELWGLK